MNNNQRGQVYLITGASGIAAATARLAAQKGVNLFLVSREAEELQSLASEIEVAAPCGYFAADLTVAGEVAAAVKACVEKYGQIDALYNVVGISGRKYGDGPLHECTEEGWDVTMATNVKSMFLTCREVIRHMLEQTPRPESNLRGSILNMASVLASSPEPRFFATHAYAASKGAIVSLTKALAAYYAPHKIRANAIAPALVRTPMSRRAQGDERILELMKTKQPLAENLIEAEDVARASLFLLGDESRMMTGEVVTIDAGWRLS